MNIKSLTWVDNSNGTYTYLICNTFAGNFFIQDAYEKGVKNGKYFAELRVDCYYDDTLWSSNNQFENIEDAKIAVKEELKRRIIEIIDKYTE